MDDVTKSLTCWIWNERHDGLMVERKVVPKFRLNTFYISDVNHFNFESTLNRDASRAHINFFLDRVHNRYKQDTNPCFAPSGSKYICVSHV